jgi:ABC-type multidrug transport system fused ATPase/permease subunit
VIPSVVSGRERQPTNRSRQRAIRKTPSWQGFLRASLAGWAYALKNQDEAISILLKEVPTANAAQQKETLAVLPALMTYGEAGTRGIGYFDMKNLEFAQKFLLENGVMKAPVDLKLAVDTSFWDKVPAGQVIARRQLQARAAEKVAARSVSPRGPSVQKDAKNTLNIRSGSAVDRTCPGCRTSTSLNSGDFVTLVGSSGCGKSTLFNILVDCGARFRRELHIDGNLLGRLRLPSGTC